MLCRSLSAVCVFTFVLVLPAAAFAGVTGQPQPRAETRAQFRAAVAQFEIPGGDLNKARPDLGLLIDTDPTQDFTPLVAPALWDDGAYRTMVQTLNDALDEMTAGDARRTFLYYNLARLNLLRARYFDLTRTKQPFLKAADAALAQIPSTLRDASVNELRGDLASERGDVTGAANSYRRIGAVGGSATYAQYKIADAYLRARRYPEAETAFRDAAKTLAAGTAPDPQLRQDIYQGLADLYVQRNQAPQALAALTEAVKGKGNVYVRTDTARKLIDQGYATEIAGFATAALLRAPGDDALEALLADAQKKVK